MSVILTGSTWVSKALRNKLSLFLVGPSKRPSFPFLSYRKRFVELAQKELKDSVVFQPEWDPTNGFGDPIVDTEQIFQNSQKWELEAMNDSKIIIMGLDTDANNLGITTRTEFGFLVESRRNLIVYAPKTSVKMNYQIQLAKMKQIPVHETLEDVIEEIKKMAKHVPFVTTGRFNSTEINANDCDPVVLRETLLHEQEQNNKGAIWCYIDKHDYLNFKLLNDMGYYFHHHNFESSTYAFYKWNDPTRPDAVHPYATAIGGSCAMILNQDESKVLFVYEESYGKKWYKFPSGAVNFDELAIECILRELMEELNLKVENIPIKLVGGYNQKSARFNKINDYFYTFVVNVPETVQIKPDGVEVLKFKWLNIKDVLDSTITSVDGVNINKFNIESLKNYAQNKNFLTCRIEDDKMLF